MAIFIPNLAFEEELSGRSSSTAATRLALDELAPLMALLGRPGDTVLLNQPGLVDDVPTCLSQVQFAPRSDADGNWPVHTDDQYAQVVPWGWTHSLRELAIRHGMPSVEIPDPDIVKNINSRLFSADYDRVICEDPERLPFGKERFGKLCDSTEQWHQSVSRLIECGFERWIAKPQISHAGRNRLLGDGLVLNKQQHGWLQKHVAHGGVYVEPWVERVAECGIQFEITRPKQTAAADPDGRSDADAVRLLGVTGLLNDPVGRYLGSLIHRNGQLEESWAASVEYGFEVCRAARSRGYFGTVGIDSFRFLDSVGRIATRLCNDVNARFTMGRLALHLRPILPEGACGLWCRFMTSRAEPVVGETHCGITNLTATIEKLLSDPAFSDVSSMRTSPLSVNNHLVTTGSFLLAGPSANQLTELSRRIRGVQN